MFEPKALIELSNQVRKLSLEIGEIAKIVNEIRDDIHFELGDSSSISLKKVLDLLMKRDSLQIQKVTNENGTTTVLIRVLKEDLKK